MKKHIFGRQLKRDVNERKALFKGLMSALVLGERIQTTEEKAKAIKGAIEKLVTKAKKKGALARSSLLPYLREDAVKRMIIDIAPRFSGRPGGYTRIIKLGRRFGDNASMVVMEWVENSSKLKVQDPKSQDKDDLNSTGKINPIKLKKKSDKEKKQTVIKQLKKTTKKPVRTVKEKAKGGKK